MKHSKSVLKKFKPRVPKRYLLFVAAAVWTLAGLMLLYKGASVLLTSPDYLLLKIAGGLVAGIAFYMLLFSSISLRQTYRIVALPEEKPSVFSFFNLKSYVLMIAMIGLGILLKKADVFPAQNMALFYIVMGTPLLMSACRFYFFGIFYHKQSQKLKNK